MVRRAYVFNALFVTLLVTSTVLQAQEFLEQVQRGMSFHDIQKAWYKKHPRADVSKRAPTTPLGVDADEKVLGEESFEEVEGEELLFARWENFWKDRLLPNGQFPSSTFLWEQWQRQMNVERELRQKGKTITLSPQAWRFLGPTKKVPTGKGSGSGRVASLRFDPENPDVMWAGTPGGGLWKNESVGGNHVWSTTTDTLPALGVTDIAINPQNPEQMFITTGDMDGTNTYAYGLMRSEDGGKTWQRSNLNYLLSNTAQMSRVKFNPLNPNIVIVGASNGVFRSTDNGQTWKSVLTISVRDIEFRPGDPNVVYVTGGSAIYRSKDGGSSFLKLTTNFSNTQRVALAVTEADSLYIYALLANNSSGFGGLYRSTNGGDSWNKMSDGTSLNILNWDVSGVYNPNGQQGQGYYDLAIAASPDDKDLIFCGGVNVWRSQDGGQTWECSAHWQGDNGKPLVHADVHDLVFQPESNYLYACCDGGVFMSPDNGATWSDISAGLGILQFYRIGTCPPNPSLVLGGCQDNGTNRYGYGDWKYVKFADGMEAFFDKTGKYAYATIYYGRIWRSQDSGLTFPREITPNGSNTGPWITPFIVNPVNPQILYCGSNSGVFRSDDRGDSWQLFSKSPIAQSVALAQPESDTARFWVSTSSKIYTTTNSGANWKDVTSNLKTGSISGIASDPTRSDVLAVTVSGFDSTSKVYLTTNGGGSWTNLTRKGLPNVPMNCAVWYKTSCLNMLIVGTDLGVYFTTENADAWQSLNTGLPRTIIRDMDVVRNLLHVGTFGRGLWELSLPQTAPVAEIKISEQDPICPGQVVHFSNESAGGNGELEWQFEGGVPATSQLTFPTVMYPTSGTYAVSLRVHNECATDSSHISAAVRVLALPTRSALHDERAHTVSVNPSGGPEIVSYQWYRGASIVSGATDWSYRYDSSGVYIARMVDKNGCAFSDTVVVSTVGVTPQTDDVDVQLFPVPATTELQLKWELPTMQEVSGRIFDAKSNEVLNFSEMPGSTSWKKTLSLFDLPAGEYILQVQQGTRTLRKSFVKVR